MFLEIIRAVADTLSDPVIGINSQLAAIPTDNGNIPLSGSTVSVFDETRNFKLAINREPEVYPAVFVLMEDAATFGGEVVSSVRTGEATVTVQMVNKIVDSDSGISDLYYLARAVIRSLDELQQGNESFRLRNGVVLQNILNLEYSPAQTYIEDGKISGIIKVTFYIRDIQP